MQQPFLFCFLFFLPVLLLAQPEPCTDPPTMTSFCKEACIICDIDGFTGRHESDIVGEAPPGFAGECTISAHNMQWIAFIAGSENLEVRMSVSNCVSNLGLEFGLYKGTNCEDLQRISNCFGGASRNTISGGESGIIRNTEPLVIGQYYYIVMDGGLGDNCDWTFDVLEGDTRVTPLNTSGTIMGNPNTCPNIEEIYEVIPPVGATEFKWELDGQDLNNNNALLPLSFDRTGIATLCVISFNACEEAPPTCQQILVTAIPPTNLDETICEGEQYEVADTILNTSGNYVFNLTTASGCDSLVSVALEVLPASFTNLGRINICEGDTLPVAGESFFTTGIHEIKLPSIADCDSTVSLDLFVVVCNIQGTITATPAACFGEASGTINFSVTNGTPPFTYNWERLGDARAGSGRVEALSENILIDNLPAGTYLVTIEDDFGNQRILIGEITQPEILDISWEVSNYNDFEISCFAGDDGAITIRPEGGTAPYAYSWENGEMIEQRRALSAGDYIVTVTDANTCQMIATVSLTQPTELAFTTNFIPPTCEGLATGSVVVEEINGGVSPYLFELNSSTSSTTPEFNNLTEGDYRIRATDVNGCEISQAGNLVAPIIPQLELGEDLTIGLADQIPLLPLVATDVARAVWRADTSLSCQDCLEPIVNPANRTTYYLTVSSIDDCVATDSLTIQVLKIRDVYVPNVFSPNQDGINDKLVIYAGPEANAISSFKIFTRWGEQIYDEQNFLPNDMQFGWDGESNGRNVGSGIYIWMAEIDFIDGERIVYSGDVALVR